METETHFVMTGFDWPIQTHLQRAFDTDLWHGTNFYGTPVEPEPSIEGRNLIGSRQLASQPEAFRLLPVYSSKLHNCNMPFKFWDCWSIVLPWLGACLVADALTPGHGSHQTMVRWARTSDSSNCGGWKAMTPFGWYDCSMGSRFIINGQVVFVFFITKTTIG